ncbi:hypothetical protein [Paucilactobacillus sp. N302-9]
MKYTAEKMVAGLSDEQFANETKEIKESDLVDQKTLESGLTFIEKQTKDDNLARYEWQVTMKKGAAISVALETNIINLPMSDAKVLSKIVTTTDEQPVNVYMVCRSEDVNKSGLRIDKLLAVDELPQSQSTAVDEMLEWLDTQLIAIHDNRQ